MPLHRCCFHLCFSIYHFVSFSSFFKRKPQAKQLFIRMHWIQISHNFFGCCCFGWFFFSLDGYGGCAPIRLLFLFIFLILTCPGCGYCWCCRALTSNTKLYNLWFYVFRTSFHLSGFIDVLYSNTAQHDRNTYYIHTHVRFHVSYARAKEMELEKRRGEIILHTHAKANEGKSLIQWKSKRKAVSKAVTAFYKKKRESERESKSTNEC